MYQIGEFSKQKRRELKRKNSATSTPSRPCPKSPSDAVELREVNNLENVLTSFRPLVPETVRLQRSQHLDQVLQKKN